MRGSAFAFGLRSTRPSDRDATGLQQAARLGSRRVAEVREDAVETQRGHRSSLPGVTVAARSDDKSTGFESSTGLG